MKIFFSSKAFTLMEILVTVIIVGVIAGFAIPNYGRTVNQSRAQDAIIQLSAIRSANQLYFAKTGAYWPTTNNNNTAAINTALSLNIIENGLTYNCQGTGVSFFCTATSTNPAYSYRVNQLPLVPSGINQNPTCTVANTCPFNL